MNNNTITFPAWPYFAEDEITAATAVLQSGKVNYWTGEEGKQFEKEFAAYTETKFAIALANGTVALELALYALGIGSGDEVIVPSRTFMATASSVVMRGATPVIADIDPDSQNITAETIAAVITPKTKAIIVVHLAGWPCNMDPIMQLAKKHKLKVIEDCAQAHGARYKGAPIGSFGDAAAFSFCQDKIMTTAGEGGMLVTNDQKLWEKAWSFKDHGKSYEKVYQESHAPGFRWLHTDFGTNWRMTEFQAAIGRLQLRKLNNWVEKRRQLAQHLTSSFEALPALRTTIPNADYYHAYYKYYVFLNKKILKKGWHRDRILMAINGENVPCFTGSCAEIYREEAFVRTNLGPTERLKIASECDETSLVFLVHPTCTEKDMKNTAQVVERVLKQATVSTTSAKNPVTSTSTG